MHAPHPVAVGERGVGARANRASQTRRLVVAATRWVPALAWMATIFFFSSQSSPPATTVFPLPSSLAHLLEYCFLGLLLAWAIRFQLGRWRPRAVAILTIAGIYALLDEYHQTMVPGRDASWLDVVLDAAGVGLGVSLTAAFQYWKAFGLPGHRPAS